MYLLNVRTRHLQHFYEPPPYAILSHSWCTGDTHRFHEIESLGIANKPEYYKADMCCKLALEDGLNFVWIDTCCADAKSSAAFTEALNSAYAWYQNAEVCYVYLDDVDGTEDPEAEDSTFRRCKWFKRSWTLQELLAPENLFFFASNWSMIGTKAGLANVISSMTGIHCDALLYPKRIPFFSVAARMSWACGRKSSKGEDRVYSLMGLFGVHLPILYGEGARKAFLKLQHKIIKTSDDQSILAWRSVSSPSSHHSNGPFADSPDCFADCGDVHCIPRNQWLEYCTNHYCSPSIVSPRLDFAKTNTGLHICLPLRPRGGDIFDAVLACARGRGVWNGAQYVVNLEGADLVRIPLRNRTPTTHHYERVDADRLETISVHQTNDFGFKEICIGAPQVPAFAPPTAVAPTFVVRYTGVQRSGFIPTFHPELDWVLDPDIAEGQVLLRPEEVDPQPRESPEFVARMDFTNSSIGESFVVELGLDSLPNGRPWVYANSASGRRAGEGEKKVFKDLAVWQLGASQVVMVTVRSLPNSARYKVDIRFLPSGPTSGL